MDHHLRITIRTIYLDFVWYRKINIEIQISGQPHKTNGSAEQKVGGAIMAKDSSYISYVM